MSFSGNFEDMPWHFKWLFQLIFGRGWEKKGAEPDITRPSGAPNL